MADAFQWPKVDALPGDDPEQRSWLADAAAVAASVGPELTRLFGLRITARRSESALSSGLLASSLATRADEGARQTIDLVVGERGLSLLMERLFGGEAGADAPIPLATLPPDSASWITLANFLAMATARALSSCGLSCPGSPVVPARPRPSTPVRESLTFALDCDGNEVLLGLSPQADVATAEPDARHGLWQEQRRTAALGVAIPVSLRLAEQRLAVADVASLKPGSVLPLDRPENVDVLVGGKPYLSLPASELSSTPDGKDPRP